MAKTKNKSKDQRLIIAKEMPSLFRTIPGKEYSYRTDEVFKWISERPGLVNYIFDKLTANGYIYFDSDTGKWQGVDYDED